MAEYQAYSPELFASAQRYLSNKLAFARISDDFVIQEASDNLGQILQEPTTSPLTGEHLTTILFEFVGSEEHIRAVLAGHQKHYCLERINRLLPNGQMLYLDYTLTPFDTKTDDSSFLLTIEDTTVFGRLEQAIVQERNELRLAKTQLASANAKLRRLDQLKMLFFSMAAHDLRAPLMVIRGYADMLQLHLTNPDISELAHEEKIAYLQTITVQSDWLDNIIHNVLDLNRIETDQLRLYRVGCDINALVKETIGMMMPMAELNQQVLVFHQSPSPLLANADPERIKQIVQNLIGNAIKFNRPNGEAIVTISADSDRIYVSVKDTGRGIKPRELSEVFELYYRVNESSEQAIKGSGLGLFIVKTLIRAHNGDIDVISEVGKGSEFTFWLPRMTEFEV